MDRFRFFVITLVLAVVRAATAQDVRTEDDAAPDTPRWSRQVWTSDDGLPSGSVVGVAVVGQSRIVVATQTGLARFDGGRWRRLDTAMPRPGRSAAGSAEDIQLLLVEPDETMHVVYADGSLVSRPPGDTGTWTISQSESPSSGRESEATTRPTSACRSADGAVWVGHADGTVTRWTVRGDGQSSASPRVPRVFGPADGLPAQTPAVVAADRAGRPWVGHLGGLAVFESGRFRQMPDVPLGHVSLAPSRAGGLWVKAGAPLYHFDEQHGFVLRADRTIRKVRTLLEDSAGRLWMGTNQFGLRLLVGDSLLPMPTHGIDITTLAEDPTGGIWAGTADAINRLASRPCWITHAPTTKPLEAFLQDASGTSWFLTLQGELGRQVATSDGGAGAVTFLVPGKDAPDQFATSMAPAADGSVLVGFKRSKLARYTAAGPQPLPLPPGEVSANAVHAVHETRDGSLWVAVGDRLLCRREDRWQRVGETIAPVFKLVEDAAGHIWACTATGELRRFDPHTLSAEPLEPSAAVGRNPISGIVPTSGGSVWIASRSRGLVRWKAGRFSELGAEHGLPTTDILAMVADRDGRLWCVCRERVFVASIDRLEAVADRAIARVFCWDLTSRGELECLDAVGDPGSNAFLDGSGRVRVALSSGMLVCDPARLTAPSQPQPAAVTGVRIDGRPLTLADDDRPIRLPPQPGTVEISFTEATLAWPTNTVVETRLDGIDSDWVAAGAARLVTYSRLPAGTHAFHLRTFTDAGTWTGAEPSLTIEVEPLLWERPWFRGASIALIAALAAALTAGVSGTRSRTKMQRLRAQAALERERLRIAQDMHDEVGTSLTQIALLAELMQAEYGTDSNADRLATVADISRHTVASMEELVWAVTPANDTLRHLITYIGPWVNQTLDRFGIHCLVEAPATVADVPASAEFRRNILLIIKEAVSNVVEHSQATEVRLVIACDGGRLRLVLTDNGMGIQPSSQRVGYGLANMRRRAEDLDGTCRITAGPEGGTVIAVDIPLPASSGALS